MHTARRGGCCSWTMSPSRPATAASPLARPVTRSRRQAAGRRGSETNAPARSDVGSSANSSRRLRAFAGRLPDVGGEDEPPYSEPAKRREQRGDAPEAIVESRERWKSLERFSRLAVEQDHSCDLFGIPAGEDPDVLRARRMADEDEGPRNAARDRAGRGGPWPRRHRPAGQPPDRSSLDPRDRRRTPWCRVRPRSRSPPNTRRSRQGLIRG